MTTTSRSPTSTRTSPPTRGHRCTEEPHPRIARIREIDPGVEVTALPALTPAGAHPGARRRRPHHRLRRPRRAPRPTQPHRARHGHPLYRHRHGHRPLCEATPHRWQSRTGHSGRAMPPMSRRLDATEVGRWGKSAEQQALDRAHGYGTDRPNPAVVHLNGIAVYAALAEIIAWISGQRPPAQYIDIDLSGALARWAAPGLAAAPANSSKGSRRARPAAHGKALVCTSGLVVRNRTWRTTRSTTRPLTPGLAVMSALGGPFDRGPERRSARQRLPHNPDRGLAIGILQAPLGGGDWVSTKYLLMGAPARLFG